MEDNGELHPDSVYLQRISRDMRELLLMMREIVKYMKDAESEVPERVRRFITYFHDIHDACYVYTEMGHEPPQHLKRELERCDDRYRQILKEMHEAGGAFEKIRRDMAKDEDNRWDHTKALTFKREKAPHETGKSD